MAIATEVELVQRDRLQDLHMTTEKERESVRRSHEEVHAC